MDYYALASGSQGNAFIIKDEDCILMIDCGSKSKKYLDNCFNEIGINKDDIDALLITHNHSDHIGQLKHFKDLNIYSFCSLNDYKFNHVVPLESFYIKHLKITAIPLSHDASNTVGYIIENNQEKLVYITDTGYIKRDYIQLVYNADYFILESNHDLDMLMHTSRPMFLKQRIAGDLGHLCNDDCANFLMMVVGDNTKEIWLAHISKEANTKELALEVNLRKLNMIKHGDLKVVALSQFEVCKGGMCSEEDTGFVMCNSNVLQYLPSTSN